MKGFFELRKESVPQSQKGRHLSCTSCGLYKSTITPRMVPYGENQKGIMVIGEAPGETEDARGKPWQGRAGEVLQRKYRELGVDLFQDCVSLNAINCRPTDGGKNRTPTEFEVACCRQRILEAVNHHKPKTIILHGGVALSSLIGHKWPKGLEGISNWRGFTIPDRTYKTWICPTFHPSYIMRQQDSGEVNVIWTQDIKQAIAMGNVPFPAYQNEQECVEIVKEEKVEETLERVVKTKPLLFSFDLETTGLKPHDTSRHSIVTVAFSIDGESAYSMMWPSSLRALKRILEHPKIGKIAANMKYENTWLEVLHGFNVAPWAWDTMLASHILDNRPGISGLKFQAFVHFGTPVYDEKTGPFLKSKDANTPNQIMKLIQDPDLQRELLIYNGIDALVTYRLAKLQMKEMGYEN